jgi:hypothetical protein
MSTKDAARAREGKGANGHGRHVGRSSPTSSDTGGHLGTTAAGRSEIGPEFVVHELCKVPIVPQGGCALSGGGRRAPSTRCLGLGREALQRGAADLAIIRQPGEAGPSIPT